MEKQEMSDFEEYEDEVVEGELLPVDKTPEQIEQERKDKEFLERLRSMDNESLGKMLLNESLISLLSAINKGWATASDINVARQFLKDNNIGIVATRANAAGALKEKLALRAKEARKGNHIAVEKLEEVDINDFISRH